MTGLYDHEGVLRFAGRDADDCLAYAELFALAPGSFSLTSLERFDRREHPRVVEPVNTEGLRQDDLLLRSASSHR